MEGRLAWDLADTCRDRLAAPQRALVFMHLGAGDFAAAIVGVLDGIAGQQSALDEATTGRLLEWLRVYDLDASFHAAVARVTG